MKTGPGVIPARRKTPVAGVKDADQIFQEQTAKEP
jgi:hypothetical protein